MSPRRLATVPHTAPRAAIYVRQSVAKEESISLSVQEDNCRDHATRNGHHVVQLISDPGVSGRKWEKRAGVQQVMAMAAAREIDVVVIYRWSRLSRDSFDFAYAIKTLQQYGVRVEAAVEPIDTDTASGELSRDVLAQINAYQSKLIGEQWEEAHQRRRSRGVPAQGGDRYGYVREGRGDSQRFLPEPEQAEHLAWMYDAFIGGMGFAAIAADLNQRGIPNRLGKPWQRTTVRQLLDSGFAAGLIVHQPRDEDGRPVGEATRTPGAHDPVITEQVWRAYQATRAGRWRTPPRVVEPRYPLTGLVRCGDCGDAMHPTTGGTGRAGHSYVCGRYRTTGQGKCVTAVRANVEKEVLAWLGGLAEDVEAAAAADKSATQRRRRARADVKSAARRVGELDRQLAELTRQLVAGIVPESAYLTTRDQLTGERAQAAEQVAQAEAEQVQKPAKARRTARSLLEDWELLAVRDRRDLLATLIERVEIHPPELVDGRRWGRSTVRIVARWD